MNQKIKYNKTSCYEADRKKHNQPDEILVCLMANIKRKDIREETFYSYVSKL